MPSFYEFFAGGGMARAGLGVGWKCLFANDFDPMKARTYARNWGGDHLVCGDVARVRQVDLPGHADLAWASFPCQDVSLAGQYRGLGDSTAGVVTRSGTFWPFWNLMRTLILQKRGPRLIVLENVMGVLTSRDGKDFVAIATVLAEAGYRFGAVVCDAKLFVPQSRPRVFFIAAAPDTMLPADVVSAMPSDLWHPAALVEAKRTLPGSVQDRWLWWSPPLPAPRKAVLADLIEEHPTGTRWHSASETVRLLGSMTSLHLLKISAAKAKGVRRVGSVYKRTRVHDGVKCVRAEIRFDDLAGCLRTPSGGSSRQTIVVVDGDRVRSRLLSTREAARLMGLDDNYALPERYNDAYHVAGDGVCVPVVRHLAQHLFEPIILARANASQLAA